eukprot:CAMPEP_0171224932 /NCGR_PEP_ID=MMETSP0790-20130122/36546_1 /TAXON_ID=2925 /ORGANISM="Alexandrium catenella, Strain OF101" /LENGTH=170 /DNA_ID=CAMNT_0011690949 /DNA_START=18 /DNA_END=526 /DNA_ORIENTATION=-
MERRLQADSRAGGVNGSAWAEAEAERRAVLNARIVRAEELQASAAAVARERVGAYEERLAELREARGRLQARLAGGQDSCEEPWRARYEAQVAAQEAIPPVSSDAIERLECSLAAASTAVQEAGRSPRHRPPESLAAALECVSRLATAERRRCALLTRQWDGLQGNSQAA